MASEKRPIITLLTDFGSRDHFVGCIKGVILGLNPNVDIVDITHEVPAHDILEAAFLLRSYYSYFPHGTIHLAVVDPGVGTRRRPLIVSTDNYIFIAPDNGLLSFIYELENVNRVIHITADHFFLKPVSKTFHGRDIFAPVAAWITRGIDLGRLGEPISDHVRFKTPQVRAVTAKLLQGAVLHIDRFGNLITNIAEKDIPTSPEGVPLVEKFLIGQKEVTSIKNAYDEGRPGELFAILGSSGFYEIAVNRGSAAAALGVGRGTEVGVVLR